MRRLVLSFDRVLYPLILLSRIGGVFPFNGRLQFSNISFIYSVFFGLALSLERLYMVANWNVIHDMILWIAFLFTQVVILISWLVYYTHAPKYGKFVKGFLALREEGREGVVIPWRSYSVLIARIVQIICLISLSRNKAWKIFDMLAFFFARGASFLVPLQFTSLTEITTYILKNQEPRLNALYLDGAGSILCRHYRICELYRLINDYYSANVLVCVGLMFCVTPPFVFIGMKKTVAREGRAVFLVFSEIVLAFYIVFVLVNTCNRLKNQVIRFNEKVKEQSRHYENFLQNEKITLYIEHDPKVTPKCSSFKLNYSLIIKLGGTCLTYMIILYQFVPMDDKD